MEQDVLKFARGLLLVFCISGMIGIALVVDDFDTLRIYLAGLVGIPAVTLLYGHEALSMTRWVQTMKSQVLLIGSVLVIFGWGNVLLLNIAADQTEVVQVAVNVKGRLMNVAHKKGAFGHLYRLRFEYF